MEGMDEAIRLPGEETGGDEPLEVTEFFPPPVVDPRFRRVFVPYPRQRSFRTNRPLAIALFVTTCFSVFLAGLSPGGGILEAGGRAAAGLA